MQPNLTEEERNCLAGYLAGWADTISYEILLSISERVPRVFLD